MAITITQTPSLPFDMGYGPNPITLSGIDTISPIPDKYALRIFLLGNPIPIADIRQTPNRVGVAIFDAQNVLQSHIGPSKYNIDGLFAGSFVAASRPLHIADGELVEYQISFNYELAGGTLGPTWTTPSTVYTTIAGSKQYNEVPFDADYYRPQVNGSGAGGCTVITEYGKALSDNKWTITEQQTGDEFLQEGYTSPGGIIVQDVYLGDQMTKTFYSPIERTGGTTDPLAQGLESFDIIQFSGEFFIANSTLNNTRSNGGGPNTAPGQGLLVGGAYQTITIACGPDNLPIPLNPQTTHYYVIPKVYDDCASSAEAAWQAQRFNVKHDVISAPGESLVIAQKAKECNDYPHIQFAWLNSLGFRDQFTFTKRNEKKINTKRNEFLKEAADYNSTEYSVDLQSRGYTTYSQTIKETWEATSGYMNNEQAELLESMFKSAQVNVKFSDGEYAEEWQPVRLQSSSYTQKTVRKDQLFQYKVIFTFANNIKSQRG